MTVRFEEKYGRIVMDHLSPEAPSMKELYSYYVPDFSYDAYIFDGEYWTLKEDVIAVNDPDIRFSKEYIQLNPRTGRLERKKFKKGWINPTNMDSEGDIEHVARTPESTVNNVPSSNSISETTIRGSTAIASAEVFLVLKSFISFVFLRGF